MRRVKLLAWLFVAATVWLVLPLLITALVGTFWIYQRGWLWYFVAATGITTLTGWWLLHATLRRLRDTVAAVPSPAACGTPLAQQARQSVKAIADRLQAEGLEWERPEALAKVVLEVLDRVSRHYFPLSEEPLLERPLPHVLGTVELALGDIRRLVAREVPFGSRITVKGWLRLRSLGQWAWPAIIGVYRGYRVARMVNPLPAAAREGIDWLSRRLVDHSLTRTQRWIIEESVMRIGDYAIQLYSGDLVLGDEYRERVSPAVAALDFAAEPLQALVVGQTKAGKSSVVNALLGQQRAAVDVLPTTDQIDLYECTRNGLPGLILRDTPGYACGDAAAADPLAAIREAMTECDLLILVCSARSAARKADCEILSKLRALRQSAGLPPVVCVLTHVDAIPKNLIGEAVAAVAHDLALTADQVTPVGVQWGHHQNVEAIGRAIFAASDQAQRLKQIRCIRQIRGERDEQTLSETLLRFGRLGIGWARRLADASSRKQPPLGEGES
jgi:GTP-binding protein EngB required for normal cell division